MFKSLGLALLFVAACGGGDNVVKVPRSTGKLAGPLAAAFREDATGDPVKAVDLYVRALDNAATSPDDPASIPVVMAALDALVHRSVSAFSDAAVTSALADRVDPAALAKSGTVDARLAKVLERADGPFAAGQIATARLALAERRGDVAGADVMRARSGCLRDALVIGPVAWTPVSSVTEATTLDVAGTPIPAELAGPGPFVTKLAPATVRALGCTLPLYA
ncbi:MAG TPA: hypothetical protein VLT33_46710, partial [Labilithrix sp.]|nr:hypothetical protein [Labilithrix sp.]